MLIKNFDYVEFYIANLPIAKFLFKYGYGFEENSDISFKQNINNNSSLSFSAVSQNNIKILLSSSLDSSSELSKEVLVSGDFIKDIAFEVEDIEQIICNAETYGVRVLEPIQEIMYEQEIIKRASIACFGNTKHSLIQKKVLSKSLSSIETQPNNNDDLEKIDHIAVAVENKNLIKWINYYKNIFGLEKIFEENVVTKHSGMNSVVIGDDRSGIKIVLVSPVDGKGKSQITDFINSNNGEGVQHIAFSTSNIIKTIKNIKSKGLEFLDINDDYYNNLDIPNSYKKSYIDDLRSLKILFDKDEYGELLQIFSKKLHTKSTWFLEIIERKGARTFGRGNIKRLYESIEKELSK